MRIQPTETLDRYINQTGITSGSAKLELFRRALALRGTPAIRSQEHCEDPVAYIKIFDPCGSWVWLLTEWDPMANEAFGLAVGAEKEFGYIDLAELSELGGALGIGMEVDVWFKPQRLSVALKGASR